MPTTINADIRDRALNWLVVRCYNSWALYDRTHRIDRKDMPREQYTAYLDWYHDRDRAWGRAADAVGRIIRGKQGQMGQHNVFYGLDGAWVPASAVQAAFDYAQGWWERYGCRNDAKYSDSSDRRAEHPYKP